MKVRVNVGGKGLVIKSWLIALMLYEVDDNLKEYGKVIK